MKAIGYGEVFDYLSQEISETEAKETMKQKSRNYAKRQMTWFKKDPSITWFTNNNQDALLEEVQNFLAEKL